MKSIVLLFLLMPVFALSQNLVMNPSFEDTTTTNYNAIYPICEYWYNPNSATSDYASPYWQELCCNGGLLLNPPLTILGFQNALDGSAYIALDLYESTSNAKEYAQGFLTEPLIAGEQYCLEIWLNLSDSTGLTTCDFQVCFTSDNVNDSTTGSSLGLTNCVEFDISNIDTSDWTLFAGNYTAQGGEQFVYLGSNTPNEQLECAQTFNSNSQIWNTAYVFVDMLSVFADEDCINSIQQPWQAPMFSIGPNPFADRLTIAFASYSSKKIMLFDMLGREVLSFSNRENVIHLNLETIANGNYILFVSDGINQSIQLVQKNELFNQ